MGILFAFYEQNKLEFVFGNAHRIRTIYADFDPQLFNSTLSFIKDKVTSHSKNLLFNESNLKDNFNQFISNNLLRDDSTVLQFTEPISAVSISDIPTTVGNYSKLLLSGIDTKKEIVSKHNEAYLIREYTKYLSEGFSASHIENKLKRNVVINYKGVHTKFDLSWTHNTTNLVKPISFDLKESADIQNKSAQWFGYCTLLSSYAADNNCRFDLLIAKPIDRKLWKDYDKVIITLNDIDAPKKIITEGQQLKSYSEETRQYLLQL